MGFLTKSDNVTAVRQVTLDDVFAEAAKYGAVNLYQYEPGDEFHAKLRVHIRHSKFEIEKRHPDLKIALGQCIDEARKIKGVLG